MIIQYKNGFVHVCILLNIILCTINWIFTSHQTQRSFRYNTTHYNYYNTEEQNKIDFFFFVISDWYYPIKYYLAKKKLRNAKEFGSFKEEAEQLQNENEQEYYLIKGIDQNGNYLVLKLNLKKQQLAEISILLKLNGTVYQQPNAPEVLLSSISNCGFKVAGLEIQVLEPFLRLRILYNGLLLNSNNGDMEYFRFNFIWTSAGKPIFYPFDCSNDLLADALARERWRNGNWLQLL